MRIVQRFAAAALVAAISFQSADAQKVISAPPPEAVEEAKKGPSAKEVLTDVAIIAILIATSIAAYKVSGRPCACPDDLMRNGRRCGDNSAYRKPGGAKPMCYPSDVSPGMIEEYRRGRVLPARLY